jgi:hypothetical protein
MRRTRRRVAPLRQPLAQRALVVGAGRDPILVARYPGAGPVLERGPTIRARAPVDLAGRRQRAGQQHGDTEHHGRTDSTPGCA